MQKLYVACEIKTQIVPYGDADKCGKSVDNYESGEADKSCDTRCKKNGSTKSGHESCGKKNHFTVFIKAFNYSIVPAVFKNFLAEFAVKNFIAGDPPDIINNHITYQNSQK